MKPSLINKQSPCGRAWRKEQRDKRIKALLTATKKKPELAEAVKLAFILGWLAGGDWVEQGRP